MIVTAWQFLFNTDTPFQGNVKFQRAAILKCDISLSFDVLLTVHLGIFILVLVINPLNTELNPICQ